MQEGKEIRFTRAKIKESFKRGDAAHWRKKKKKKKKKHNMNFVYKNMPHTEILKNNIFFYMPEFGLEVMLLLRVLQCKIVFVSFRFREDDV